MIKQKLIFGILVVGSLSTYGSNNVPLAQAANPESGHANLGFSNAAAIAAVGLNGETDRKSAEADVKSSSAIPTATRPRIKRSGYPFWNINQETPERRARMEARMATDAHEARLTRAEQSIDEIIIPQAIEAANAGNFEDVWEAYHSLPVVPIIPARQARIEILNALFQMDSPWAVNKQYSDEERELRMNILSALIKGIGRRGFHKWNGDEAPLLEIPESWLNFLLYPILHRSYHHPYELACEIEHNSDQALFVMDDPWAIRGLLAKKYQQFGPFELYMVTALLGKNGLGNSSPETRENDLKQFSDEQRRVIHNVGGASTGRIYQARREFKERFKERAIPDHRDNQAIRNELNAHQILLPELRDIVAQYAKSYRWGADAQLDSRTMRDVMIMNGVTCQMVLAEYALIDDLETLDADTKSVVTIRFHLHGNLFSRLPERMALKFPHMASVSVRAGLLKFIPQSTFEGASELEELDLSHNFLTDIPYGIYELPMLRKLDLEGNPLSEDAQKRYQAWQERRKKLQEGANANAAATASAKK
jgi:hypothetical protein